MSEEKYQQDATENLEETVVNNDKNDSSLAVEVEIETPQADSEYHNEKDRVEELELQLAEEKDKYMRLFAEFENHRKRTAKERLELYSTASEGVLVELLPVLDDFERAVKELYKKGDEDALKGVELIYTKFKKVLENKGLKEIETKEGDALDTDIHEAVTQIPAPSEALKGKIVDTIEKGYQLNEKVIRYAKVVIGQ